MTSIVVPSQQQQPKAPCRQCHSTTNDSIDSYCRRCGALQLLKCGNRQCLAPVRVDDRYCARCGRRRWPMIELLMHGKLSDQSPKIAIAVIGIGIAVVGLVYYYNR